MAIYHLSVKTISRSSGRSATGAAAYRSSSKITDLRTGEVHDYERKQGVEHTQILLPPNAPDWALDRTELWNAAEQAERRKNSTVAREFEIALPSELSEQDRQHLACEFAQEIVQRHGCAVDVAIHAPGKAGDQRNHHAHLLLSTRRLTQDGFTEKTRELDERKSGEIDHWRSRFAKLQNEYLGRASLEIRVDHRSLKAQGIEREPTLHLGPAVTAMERRGERTDLGAINQRIRLAFESGQRERQALTLVDQEVIDTQTSLSQALLQRGRVRALSRRLERGADTFVQGWEQDRHKKALEAQRLEQERQQLEKQQALERAQHLELQRQREQALSQERKRKPMDRQQHSQQHEDPESEVIRSRGPRMRF